MKNKQPKKFRFRRNDNIGAAAAEDDERFLASCFIDNGDTSILRDCSNPIRLIVGRTGSGKTALIKQLLKNDDTVNIAPESLSFNYLSNSNILRSLVASEANLDLFFKLLWRHVFVVELLQKKFNLKDPASQQSLVQRLMGMVNRDRNKERAITYLSKFGDKFWETTDYRVKEITEKFAGELKNSLGAKFHVLEGGVEAIESMSVEQKAELNEQAQRVVNEIQMRELTNIFTFLDEDVFTDPQNPVYIVIDRLDENWVDDKFRFHLIRSLIETIREFNKVRNVKIIAALRSDLLDRVFRFTRDGGFQEEKFRSLYLNLQWGNVQLKSLIDSRVNHFIRTDHPGEQVKAKDVLPKRVKDVSGLEYMLNRTLYRPRELIEFFNQALVSAEGQATITTDILLRAEANYSRNRLRSLQDEWFSDFPKLIEFTTPLKKFPVQFKAMSLNDELLLEFCVKYAIEFSGQSDYLSEAAYEVANSNPAFRASSIQDFRQKLIQVLYKTGVAGVKTEAYDRIQWSFIDAQSISASMIDEECSVRIHPTFWRVLGNS